MSDTKKIYHENKRALPTNDSCKDDKIITKRIKITVMKMKATSMGEKDAKSETEEEDYGTRTRKEDQDILMSFKCALPEPTC
jgi:hypothetical protein